MDLAKVLQELHEELANLDAAISSLERLQETNKQRSREDWPAALAQPSRPVRKRRGRKPGASASAAGGLEPGSGESGSGDGGDGEQ